MKEEYATKERELRDKTQQVNKLNLCQRSCDQCCIYTYFLCSDGIDFLSYQIKYQFKHELHALEMNWTLVMKFYLLFFICCSTRERLS